MPVQQQAQPNSPAPHSTMRRSRRVVQDFRCRSAVPATVTRGAARVARVLAHYEQQSEEEAVAEDEAAVGRVTETTMGVPVQLVPKVRELIAKQRRRGCAA